MFPHLLMKPSALWALFSVLLDVNHISWSVFRMITPFPLGLISSSWVNYFSFVCPELLKHCSAAVPRSSRGLLSLCRETQHSEQHIQRLAFIYIQHSLSWRVRISFLPTCTESEFNGIFIFTFITQDREHTNFIRHTY